MLIMVVLSVQYLNHTALLQVIQRSKCAFAAGKAGIFACRSDFKCMWNGQFAKLYGSAEFSWVWCINCDIINVTEVSSLSYFTDKEVVGVHQRVCHCVNVTEWSREGWKKGELKVISHWNCRRQKSSTWQVQNRLFSLSHVFLDELQDGYCLKPAIHVQAHLRLQRHLFSFQLFIYFNGQSKWRQGAAHIAVVWV